MKCQDFTGRPSLVSVGERGPGRPPTENPPKPKPIWPSPGGVGSQVPIQVSECSQSGQSIPFSLFSPLQTMKTPFCQLYKPLEPDFSGPNKKPKKKRKQQT